MIGKLTGQCGGRTPDGALLIEVGGVGYTVRAPLSLSGVSDGQPLSVFIHTAVRDDAIDLYGFASHEELAFFRQLMSVSGVGPKTALNILSVSEIMPLKRAIAAGDNTTLVKVFGIGKKSAERIVVELRDKILPGDIAPATADNTDADVMEALQALGYNVTESRAALKHVGGDEDTRTRIAAALKFLGTGKTS